MGIGSGEGIAELYMGLEEYDTGEVTGPRSKGHVRWSGV
jgi:hypothetical protein